MEKRKYEIVAIEKLKPYENNARTHSEEQIDKIIRSIEEFGFINPVLVDSDYGIIAGHGRVIAAQKMGFKDLPCLFIEDLSEVQKRAYILADNKLALDAGWDEEILNIELQALYEMDFDISLTGFELEDISIDVPVEVIEDEYEVKVPEQPKSKLGDIYKLGRHRLMCGDSTSAEDVERLMDGARVDLLITDPPYNVAYEGKTKDALTIANDEMSDDNFREFLRSAFFCADNVMKEGAVFYIWHADSEGYNFRGACHDIGWQVGSA